MKHITFVSCLGRGCDWFFPTNKLIFSFPNEILRSNLYCVCKWGSQQTNQNINLSGAIAQKRGQREKGYPVISAIQAFISEPFACSRSTDLILGRFNCSLRQCRQLYGRYNKRFVYFICVFGDLIYLYYLMCIYYYYFKCV